MIELDFEGNVKLREDYRDSQHINYLAVLNGSVQDNKNNDYLPTEVKNLAVPICREKYFELKKQLESSSAQQPILRFRARIPIKLESVCIN